MLLGFSKENIYFKNKLYHWVLFTLIRKRVYDIYQYYVRHFEFIKLIDKCKRTNMYNGSRHSENQRVPLIFDRLAETSALPMNECDDSILIHGAHSSRVEEGKEINTITSIFTTNKVNREPIWLTSDLYLRIWYLLITDRVQVIFCM